MPNGIYVAFFQLRKSPAVTYRAGQYIKIISGCTTFFIRDQEKLAYYPILLPNSYIPQGIQMPQSHLKYQSCSN